MQLERPRLVEPLPLGPAPLPPDFDLGPFADAVSAAAPREAEPIDDAAPTAVETDAAYAPPSAESSQQTEALVTSLTAARTAFLTALSGIVRSSMVGTMKPSPSTTTSPRLDTGAHDLLNTLIEQLRSLPSSSTGMVELTTWSEPIDELQARLKLIVSPDAALAVSLGTLLHCIERLMVLYAGAPSTRPSRPASSAGVASWTGGSDGVTVSPFDVYEAIEREADALRSNTRDREAATRGALREVEQAEKDLLWARIDLLLVQVKMLSRDGDTVPVPMTSELPQYELPPGYGNVDGDAAEVMMVPDEKRRIVGGRTDEKMARDLEGVTEAVERLYLISPQLANQRADPDRRQARELALVRLGNAIERLSRGRLDDQRANTIPGQRNGKERADDYAARRRQSLDQLLDSIDRATKRTLSNQRASIDPRQRTILLEARRAAKDAMADFSAADRREEMRLQHIVERTGVGRMSSQDAALGSQLANYRLPGTPSPPAHRPSSSPPPKILPSSAGKDRARSNSVSTLPSVKKRFSMGRLRLSREHSTETVPPLPRSPSRVSPPLPAVSSKGGTLGLRRHTVATDALVELRYLAQVQSNIGTLLIRAWVDGGAVDGWALSSLDGDAAMLRHGVTGVLARIPFPTRVTVPTPWPALVHRDDHLELRLRTADAAVLTRSRPDLELTTPCSAAELKRHPPSSFVCSTCEATLVRVPDGCTMPSLPSEHWAELLEAWMCHTDQVLHDDVASRTSNGFWPRDNELAIASAHILCPITTTSGWAVTPGVEPKLGADVKWYAIRCTNCSSPVGHVTAATMAGPALDGWTCLRLAKYAMEPRGPLASATVAPLSLHISAHLLELSSAHGAHRFVLEDEEGGQARLLIWIFNPSMRIACRADWSDTDLSSSISTSGSSALHVMSVLYRAIDHGRDDNDATLESFRSNGPVETVDYPLVVCRRLVSQLEASTALHPPSWRSQSGMSVGFLARL